MVQFATPLDLDTYLGGTAADDSELSADFVRQANLILELISADIEAAAGVKIESTTTTVDLPGSWARDLELPAGQIREVTSVTVNGTVQQTGSYHWNGLRLIRRGFDLINGLIDSPDESAHPHQGAAWRAGDNWSGPFGTVRVSYTAGFAAIPDFIKSLTLRIAARTLNNVDDVTQESLAVYSVTYRNTANDGSHVRDAERRRLRNLLNRTGGTLSASGR